MPNPHEEQIDSKNPTFFLFLVDQSGSMSQPFEGFGDRTMADGVATVINRIIRELVLQCSTGDRIRDRYYIGMIGYNNEINLGFGGELAGRYQIPVSEVGQCPLRMETRVKKLVDDTGDIIETTEKFLVWVDPVAKGKTRMCEALDLAKESVANFVEEHPGSFPPIVINITDGVPTDAGDPPFAPVETAATAIQSVKNENGSNVLLFNIHITPKQANPIMFPTNEEGLRSGYSKLLFRMSSPLTDRMVQLANMQEADDIAPGSRGFVYQGDLVSVVRLLQIGTRVQ